MHGYQTWVFGRQFLGHIGKESVNYEKNIIHSGLMTNLKCSSENRSWKTCICYLDFR